MTSQQDDSRDDGVLAVLARVRRDVAALTGTLWAARTPVELMDGVAEVEALKSVLDAVEVAMVGELDATGAVKATGWASTQDFVTSVAGGHKGTGPAVVRLAKAVEELPGDPELRCRAVQVLLEEAKRLDATELRKVTRRLLSIVDPDGEDRRDEKALDREERAAHLNRHFSLSSTSDACSVWSPPRSGRPWWRGTGTAGSRAAPGRR